MTYRLDNTLGFSIHRAAVCLKHELGQRLRPHDVTPEQFAVLSRLWEDDGLSQRVLAERLLKDKPNVTRILDKLESKGLAVRHPDPEDRRAYCVRLTEQGRALQDQLMKIVFEVRQRAYKGIGPSQRESLRLTLEKVYHNLED